MAGKSVTKRARVDASSSRDGNAMTAASQSTTAAGDADQRIDEETVKRLRTELETATKCIEQLRREKDYEIRQVREEEQNRSSTAMKELESRLKADCRREIERARETVKTRLEADTARLVGRYERTVKRLSNDLDRCRNELREEIEKRGMSSTTRGGFETERCRLLAEVRDLKAAKRRLEETIESAAEVDKQKTAELKRMQEACKAEVAKVSKEATAEIRKLLEELKAKDHQLALLDRNQYADRGASLPKHSTVEHLSKETETVNCKPVKPVATDEAVDQSSTNDVHSEKISKLEEDVKKLTVELAASESDRTSMKFRLDELSAELAQRNEIIASLRVKADDSVQPTKPSCIAAKTSPKAVRFLLPGSTSPVLAREIDQFDDDSESICSEDTSCSSSSSVSSERLSPDTTVLYNENIERNYQLLLTEHLNLERSISLLLSSYSSSKSSESSPEASDAENKTTNCTRKECVSEKDSLRMAIKTLKDKHTQHEETVYQLQRQLTEKHEQYEDLEFHAFELEECAEKCKLAHSSNAAEELLEKTRCLEGEISALKKQIAYYTAIENDVEQCNGLGLGLREAVTLIKNELNNAKNESTISRQELMALRKSLAEVANCQLNVTNGVMMTGRTVVDDRIGVLVNPPPMTLIDGDDLSTCAMNSSMSTTSGFDDDNSCASSVADLRLEEMPSEETWGFDYDDDYVDQDVQSSGNPCTIHDHSVNVVPKVVVAFDENSNVDETKDFARTDQTSSEIQLETVRKSDEEIWFARIEKLEARLTQAIQNEQRARDQAALLTEEKDRRIMVLQEQVDMLESNEFRLSETIRSLERLERTFGFHLLSVENRTNSTSSSKSSSSNGVTDTATIVAEDEDYEDNHQVTAVASPAEPDDNCFPYDDVIGVVELMRETVSENRIRFETSVMIRASLDKLRQAAADSEMVDRKIKELGDVTNETTVDNARIDCGETSMVEETNNDLYVSAQIVDFESEYRELEGLVKELKKVLVLEKEMGCGVMTIDAQTDDMDGGNQQTDSVEAIITDDASSCWMTGSVVSYSVPGTPLFEFQSAVTGSALEKSLQFELTEKHLTQQIQSLEHERDVLRDAVLDGESTLRELGIQLVELQSSEESLKNEVSRLKAKEDWMISRNNELMELVGRLEDSVKIHRAAETEMRSRCERHCAEETERGRELEDARDEQRAIEARYRRWIAQLDDEKVQLQSLVDELMEKNSDLEGREAGLLCRIRKLEAAEFGLRNEVVDFERILSEMTDERDRLLMQISELDEVEAKSSGVQSVDGWTQSDVDENESEERVQRLVERAEFFKEMLEFAEQSYAALESRLVDCAKTESTLRSTVAEYEKNDKIWADRCESLETDNDVKERRIAELETTVIDIKTRLLQFESNEEQIRPLASSEEFTAENYSLPQMKQAAVSFRNIMLLSEIADELDDAELTFWAAVENVKPIEDAETERDLSSAMWSDVEARMGLNVESSLKSDERKRVHQLSLTLTPGPPSKKTDDGRRSPSSENQQPPPLPLSPPPSSPNRVNHMPENTSDYRSSFGVNKQASDDRRNVSRIQPRSHSVDLFSSKPTSDDNRWKRASSENRDPEILSKSAWFIKESDAEVSKAYHRMDQEWHRSSSSAAATATSSVKDPIMERISRSREFWSSRSLSVPCQQQTLGSQPSTNSHGTSSSSNGRPSLIPRIATPLRIAPPVRRSNSEYGAVHARTPTTAMPVIRSTPSPHLSPRLTDAELEDKKNNRSYIPRPINEYRSITSGSDSDSSDQTPEAINHSKVTQHGRPGPRVSSKIYTTILNPNRYVTSKFSYLSGSSANPHGERSNVTDSKKSPSSSFATGTNHVRRPVVSSTAVGPEVRSLPGSRA